jgi:exodeoxyribonuclease V beta subunit
LASFAGADWEAWLALPSTRALAAAWLPGEARTEALRWIYHAMTLPYALPDGTTAVLHESEELLRELDFLTPYADRQDFLHGSMDVLFRTGNKAYVLDWKTNRLSGYDPASLDQTVKEHYWLQVQIYASTACRFLGIQNEAHYESAFGGVVYVFLRGLPEGGIWTCRPTWAGLQAWEAEFNALPVDKMIPTHAGGEPRDR